MKRLLDVSGAALGLLMLAPLFAGLALAIAVSDGRPVLFRQQRVGRDGRLFWMWKFRTMVRDAPARGGALTPRGDPRITPLGGWLRRCRLDELPQLVNVLLGDMSLVGPRPEMPEFVARYTHAERPVLALRPGITDPASLAFLDEDVLLAQSGDPGAFYVAHVLPAKVRLNLAYARTATTWTDLQLVSATIRRLAARATPATAEGDALVRNAMLGDAMRGDPRLHDPLPKR